MPADKQLVREAARKARESLDPAARAKASRAIADRLAALPVFGTSRTVALYSAIGSEVSTDRLEAAVLVHNGYPCYPRVVEGGLLFYAACRDELTVDGKLRIPEPPPDPERLVPASAIDLFVVPGVAFDAARHRLGYGRGFYDRALAGTRGIKIGLSFEAQLVPAIPFGGHDLPMDAVVTETRVI